MNRRDLVRRGAAAGLGLLVGGAPRTGRPGLAAAEVVPVVLADLRARLNGTLLLPGDGGFDPARAPANGRYRDVRPMAVARCADEADVVTCVAWCAENGVPPTVRGGGHSYAGYSTTTGLLIDLRRLNSVHVDRRAGTMVTGGAALNADLFVALENGPLFLPGGTCPTVGVGGLTLGGGIGVNSRWAGLTCDHLRASRIVTADSETLDIDARNDPDLFWACQGGAGGSFGINTAFRFDLVEAPTAPIAWFELGWRGAEAVAAVLTALQTILATAPPAFNAVAVAEAAEPGTGGERDAIAVTVFGRYIGPADDARDLLAPLLALRPSTQRLNAVDFWTAQRRDIEALEPPHAFNDVSRYADRPVPADVVSALVDLLVECPHRSPTAYGSVLLMGWVGGAVDALPRDATAYVHRGMTGLWRASSVWPLDAPADVEEDLTAWTGAVIAALAPETPHESYQNFPNRGVADWQRAYYGENFDRLVAVKTRYDPGNLFRNAQSIPVRSRG